MKTSLQTRLIETVADLRQWRKEFRISHASPVRVGFVPTMGALHEGHMTLVRKAVAECDQVVVSIFVNPMQFGANEDFGKYPRTFEADMNLCRKDGVNVVFFPSVAEMYPRGSESTTKVVPPESLVNCLCGVFRPGHFTGVATVVEKLFGQVEPDIAYFGEKDYQQLTVLRRMAQDLDSPVTICGVPTVRESDGLAMSSRNVYLNQDQRKLAPRLYETLCLVRDKAKKGNVPLADAVEEGRKVIQAIPNVELQYLEARNAETLEPAKSSDENFVVLVAAKFGDVRLIDNLISRNA